MKIKVIVSHYSKVLAHEVNTFPLTLGVFLNKDAFPFYKISHAQLFRLLHTNNCQF